MFQKQGWPTNVIPRATVLVSFTEKLLGKAIYCQKVVVLEKKLLCSEKKRSSLVEMRLFSKIMNK